MMDNMWPEKVFGYKLNPCAKWVGTASSFPSADGPSLVVINYDTQEKWEHNVPCDWCARLKGCTRSPFVMAVPGQWITDLVPCMDMIVLNAHTGEQLWSKSYPCETDMLIEDRYWSWIYPSFPTRVVFMSQRDTEEPKVRQVDLITGNLNCQAIMHPWPRIVDLDFEAPDLWADRRVALLESGVVVVAMSEAPECACGFILPAAEEKPRCQWLTIWKWVRVLASPKLIEHYVAALDATGRVRVHRC